MASSTACIRSGRSRVTTGLTCAALFVIKINDNTGEQGAIGLRELQTTLTKRGQITVPAEVRRLLGLKPYDKVSFTIDDGEVRLRAASFTLETAYRSVPPLRHPITDEEMSRIAKEEKAERSVRVSERE